MNAIQRYYLITDLLSDAVPESLKNMLLVMDTAGIFESVERQTNQSASLWDLTWDKLDTFLPSLMSDLFGDRHKGMSTTGASHHQLHQNPDKRSTEPPPQVPPTVNVERVPVHVGKCESSVDSEVSKSEENVESKEETQEPVRDDADHAVDKISVTNGQESLGNVADPITIPMPTDESSFNDGPVSPMDPPCVPNTFFIPNNDEQPSKPSTEVLPPNAEMPKPPPSFLPSTEGLAKPPPFLPSKDEMSSMPRLPFRSTQIPAPMPTIISLPSRPTIAPMPPPPPGKCLNSLIRPQSQDWVL